MTYILLSLANFMYIFLKAWQGRNIAHLHYKSAAITNVFLVVAEMFVFSSIALAAIAGGALPLLYTFIALSIGGGSGCVLSMYLHAKYLTREGCEL